MDPMIASPWAPIPFPKLAPAPKPVAAVATARLEATYFAFAGRLVIEAGGRRPSIAVEGSHPLPEGVYRLRPPAQGRARFGSPPQRDPLGARPYALRGPDAEPGTPGIRVLWHADWDLVAAALEDNDGGSLRILGVL